MSESQRPDAPLERPLSPLSAALWSVLLTMTFMVAVSLTESARPGAQSDLVNLAACQVLATSLVIFGMARWHAPGGSLRAALGVRPVAVLHVPLAVAVGAGLHPLMATIDDLLTRRFPIDDPAAVEGLAKMLSSSSRAALVVGALVVVPVARELFFRGILYGGLRATSGPRAAIVTTAVFYACAYVEPREMPSAVALGLALAWLRERTGTVVTPVVAQVAYGAVAGIPILMGRDPAADVTYAPRWVAGGAVIALLALVGVGAGREQE